MIVFQGELFPQQLDRFFLLAKVVDDGVVQLMEIEVATLARLADLWMVPFEAVETDHGRAGSLHLQAGRRLHLFDFFSISLLLELLHERPTESLASSFLDGRMSTRPWT